MPQLSHKSQDTAKQIWFIVRLRLRSRHSVLTEAGHPAWQCLLKQAFFSTRHKAASPSSLKRTFHTTTYRKQLQSDEKVRNKVHLHSVEQPWKWTARPIRWPSFFLYKQVVFHFHDYFKMCKYCQARHPVWSHSCSSRGDEAALPVV